MFTREGLQKTQLAAKRLNTRHFDSNSERRIWKTMCLAEGARPKAIRERSSMTLKTFHPLFSRRCLVAPLWVLNVFLEMSRQIASQGCTKGKHR